jgi:heme exporter protein CcmD
MGGYAWFVWGAYGVTALAFLLEMVALQRRRQRALSTIARYHQPREITR